MHWGLNASGDPTEAAHVGFESEDDEASPCEKPEPGDSITADDCQDCGTDVFKVTPDGNTAACEECGSTYPLGQYEEDDLVWS